MCITHYIIFKDQILDHINLYIKDGHYIQNLDNIYSLIIKKIKIIQRYTNIIKDYREDIEKNRERQREEQRE